MQDERSRVLTLLAEGRLTVEQAAEVLDRLDRASSPQTHAHDATSAAVSRPADARFTAAQLVELAEAGVDASFIRRLDDAGLTDLTVPQMIQLVEVGAEPDLVRAVRDAHLVVTFDELLAMAEAGVDAEFMDSLRRAHMTPLSAAEVVELLESGVDPI